MKVTEMMDINIKSDNKNNCLMKLSKLRNKIPRREKNQFDYVIQRIEKMLDLMEKPEACIELLMASDMIVDVVSSGSAVINYLAFVCLHYLNEDVFNFDHIINNKYVASAIKIDQLIHIIESDCYEINPSHISVYLLNEHLDFVENTIILIYEYVHIKSDFNNSNEDILFCNALRQFALELDIGELVIAFDEILYKVDNTEESIIQANNVISSSPVVADIKNYEISDGVFEIDQVSRVQYITSKNLRVSYGPEKSYPAEDIIYCLVEDPWAGCMYSLLGWIVNELSNGLAPLPGTFKDFLGLPYVEGDNCFRFIAFSVADNEGNLIHFIIQGKNTRTVLSSNLSSEIMREAGFPPEIMNKSYRKMLKKNKISIHPCRDQVICFSGFGGSYAIKPNSTALDFSYILHTEIGLHTSMVVVNNKMVDLNYEINNGDVIFIKCNSNRIDLNSLNCVTSNKAKRALRKYLKRNSNIKDQDQKIIASQNELDGIVPPPTLFISYSWNETVEVDNIEKKVATLFKIVRDVDLHTGDNLVEFMKSIRKQDHAILIISDQYLKSRACMFELIETFKDVDLEKFNDRMHFLVMDSAQKVFNAFDRLEYLNYWNREEERYKEMLRDIPTEKLINYIPYIRDCKQISEIASKIGDILDYISNHIETRSVEKMIDLMQSYCDKI